VLVLASLGYGDQFGRCVVPKGGSCFICSQWEEEVSVGLELGTCYLVVPLASIGGLF
jgi:hypothetical protein